MGMLRTPGYIGGLSSHDIRPAGAVEKYSQVKGSLSLFLIVVSHLDNQNYSNLLMLLRFH